MVNKKRNKFLALFLTFILFFSLLTPISVVAEEEVLDGEGINSSTPFHQTENSEKVNVDESDYFSEDFKQTEKEELEQAIYDAEQNKETVKISDDGTDIAPTDYWVTEEEYHTFVKEIISAQQLLADENAVQEDVDARVLALNQAIAAFNETKKVGTEGEIVTASAIKTESSSLQQLIEEQLNKNFEKLVELVPEAGFGTLGGEWTVFSLARGEYEVPDGYYDTYYDNVVQAVQENMAEEPVGKLHRYKGTEHSRAILGLTAIGKNIKEVSGYDLREALADFDYVTTQGINGPIFALIAFDTYNYDIPVDDEVENQTTREKLIQFILEKEISGGGWSLWGDIPDPDITAMTIQSLTPYYAENDEVKASVDRAIAWLSSAQNENGGYESWGTENSESVAQVIVALTGLGIDPHTDERFIKNGHSAVDSLLSFANPDGGFEHIHDGGVDGMATDQGTYALVAYERFIHGKNRLYDMTDVTMEDYESDLEDVGNSTDDEETNNEEKSTEGITDNTITLSIDKFTIDKGYVLEPTQVEFTSGDSVWAVLQREMDKRGIEYEYSYYPMYDSVYVEWIDGDGEFDHGPGSGWMYNVNGWYPNYGASQYILKAGDIVQWRYTTNLGADLGQDLSKWVDKTALDNEIKTAEANKETVYISVDGKDIDPSDYWVTQQEYDEYEIEIQAAKAVLENKSATQDEVNATLSALKQATQTFNEAKKAGIKERKSNTVIEDQLNKNFATLVKTVPEPTFGTLAGDWTVLSLARGEYEVPAGYYESYYENVVQAVQENMAEEPVGKLHKYKGTEHSRAILGLTAIGKNIEDVGGYDLREALADFDYVTTQGINGPIFALIAFDTYNYDIPVDDGVENQTTREKLIQYILEKEIPGGGWALWGNTPDPDITAMAVQSLTPYYEEKDEVKAAIDRAIAWLSSAQNENGGYESWGTENSESVAQVIVALTGLGIDPHTDERFIKNDHSAVDSLMSFAISEGGFEHYHGGGVDGMATDQGTYALVAYDRFVQGKNRLYNMTDVTLEDENIEEPNEEVNKIQLEKTIQEAVDIQEEIKVSKDGSDIFTTEYWVKEELYNTLVQEIISAQELLADTTAIQEEVDAKVLALNRAITVINEAKKTGTKETEAELIEELTIPEDGTVIVPSTENKDYKITVPASHSHPITIKIPENIQSKTYLYVPTGADLPEIKAERNNVQVEIPAGIKVKQEEAQLELITIPETINDSIKNELNSFVEKNNKELEKIEAIFEMGGSERIEFTDYVTLTFKGLKGKEAAYIQNGQIHAIEKFATEEEGKKSGNLEFSYDHGNDLVVKTKHFTEFISYSVKEMEENEGSLTTPSKYTITLSIDKFTIGKGYVLEPTKVEFTPGESMWDVLQREMDKRGIEYRYSYYDKYDSVYIEWIDGDGEFDHGSGSGWMYNVNGWYPNYGASLYMLADGDIAQWRYTTNLGADLGEDLSKWEEKETTTEPTTLTEDNQTIITVPENSEQDFEIDISKELQENEKVLVKLPNSDVKVALNLEAVKDYFPNIEVAKGDKLLVIEKGTKLVEAKDNKMEVFSDIQTEEQLQKMESLINEALDVEKTVISDAFNMGSSQHSVLFDKLVTLTLKEKKDQKIGYIDENGTWHEIVIYPSEKEGEEANKDFKEKTFAYVSENDLIVKTNHFTTFVLYSTEAIKEEAKEESKAILDLNEIYTDAQDISSWAYESIREATEKELIAGYEGKIHPQTKVTRAEFAKLLVTMLGFEIEEEHVTPFTDVKTSDWFYPYVNTAYKHNIVKGYGDQFLPNDSITREEMAVMLVRALGVKEEQSNRDYKDTEFISPWAKTSIDTVSALQLMGGYDDRFHPKDIVTREMAIAVALNARHYKNDGQDFETHQ